MKLKPAALAALIMVAAVVSEGFDRLSQHVIRGGEAWLVSVCHTAKHEISSRLVTAGAGMLVRWAKS